MYEMLAEFIKPELLSLIPALYLFGMALKNSSVANNRIPLILGTISVVLSLMFILATTAIMGWQDALLAVFSGVTQGILCAGTSVYINQVIKQSGKDE